MCYYLYGSINQQAYNESFFSVCRRFGIAHTQIPEGELPFQCDCRGSVFFRLNGNCCDCNTPLGSHKPGSGELDRYLQWIKECKTCKNIKYVALLKYWAGSDRKKVLQPMQVVSINQVDTKFLSEITDDTLYKLHFYL